MQLISEGQWCKRNYFFIILRALLLLHCYSDVDNSSEGSRASMPSRIPLRSPSSRPLWTNISPTILGSLSPYSSPAWAWFFTFSDPWLFTFSWRDGIWVNGLPLLTSLPSHPLWPTQNFFSCPLISSRKRSRSYFCNMRLSSHSYFYLIHLSNSDFLRYTSLFYSQLSLCKNYLPSNSHV